MMEFRKLLLTPFLFMSGQILAQATLKIEVETPEGWHFHTQQILDETSLKSQSKSISAQTPPAEYQAIRCDGPWGAVKYTVSLSSGPGIKILYGEDGLYLQVLEYSVDSKDRAIESMSIQCIDTQPTQIINAIKEIELTIDKESTEQVELSNGYILKYHYKPG
ncbi:hypothetical protein [Microbulbifer variabilis]|uniref:hypothetical protein n=1 Tax=Microbulbifer variabilis TaxID=266805 RepID=UPI001CFCACFA|nr:hypothetical protein [Microbulbifer variabilis]